MKAKDNQANIIKSVAAVLAKEPAVLFGYVFGSMVRGDARVGSDVDVAVYLDGSKDEDTYDIRLKLMESLTREVGTEADVVIMNTAKPVLRYTIIREGKLVIDNSPGRRIDFELKAANEYFDFQPNLKMYRDRLHESV